MSFFSKVVFLISLIGFNVYSGVTLAKTEHYEAAIQAYNEQDVDAAFIHLKNALRENESNLPAKLLLAEVLIKKNSYSAAKQELDDALFQGADFNLIVEPLGRVMLLQGQFEAVFQLADQQPLQKEGRLAINLIIAKAHRGLSDIKSAESIYKQILTTYPNHIEATIELASIFSVQNNITQAESLLTTIEMLAENNSRLWQVKGQLSGQKGLLEEAMGFLKKANELEPDNVATLRAMANNYIELKQPRKALETVNIILTSHPKDLQAQLTKGNILKLLDESQLANEILLKLTNQLSSIDEGFMLSQPQLLLIDAMSSYKQGNWLQAQKKFKIYVNQDLGKEDISAVMLLADVHTKLKQPDQALKLLVNYETRLIKNKDYALILAGLYLQFGQNFKADYVLGKLRAQYKNDENILILSARVLSATGQDKEALALLETTHFDYSANYQHTLTVIALRLKEASKSLAYAESLITLSPENIDYQLLYTRVLVQLGKFNHAEKIITALYQKNAENKQVRFSYAFLQFNLNNYEVAEKILRELVNEDANDSDSWFVLAQIAFDSGKVEETIAILERQTKSENAAYRHKALDKLANVYYSQQQFEKSLSVINILLQKNRLNAEALLFKAKNLIALRRMKDAKHQLDILLSLWSEDPRNLLRLSKLQRRINDSDGAEKSLTIAYGIAPNALPVVIDFVKLQIRRNKLTQANNVLTKADKAGYNGNIFLTILKGDIAVRKNNIETAFNFYFSALAKDDANVIALMKLAQVSQTDALSNKFIKRVSALVKKHPERAVQRHAYADHLFTQQNYAQAKFQYQTLITQDIPSSKRAWALNNLAAIHLLEENYQSAVEVSQQAYKMLAAPAIIDTYGWSLVLSKDVEKGLSYLRQAFSMSSTNPEIKYHIAYALVQLNRKAEAKTLLQSIVKLPEGFVEHELAKQLLDSL
ncbi:MAG: PEP-CTERM system TPR-repeat protein PrsT [Colwellia sp.]